MTRQVLIPRLLPAHLPAPDPAGRVAFFSGNAMGTSWRVQAVLPAELPPANAHAAILAALDRVIRQMSHWDPDSDLCRFNRAAAGTWQPIPSEFFTVLRSALDIAALSGGAYDPTLGPLVDLYGFGPVEPPAEITDSRLAAARLRAGWQRLGLDPDSSRVFQPGGLQLDLSAIAKGFAVDHVAEILTRLGVRHQLVEIGGELRGHGCKPDGSPWWCQLEAPDETGAAGLAETVIALCGVSVATSGDFVRRRQVGGREISHLLDPRTGSPAPHTLAAVSVIAGSCMEADAWATALFVPGLEDGLALAGARGLAARFLSRSAAGIDEFVTTAWLEMAEDPTG